MVKIKRKNEKYPMKKRQKLTGIEIPLARPDITGLERKYVLEVSDTSNFRLGLRLRVSVAEDEEDFDFSLLYVNS